MRFYFVDEFRMLENNKAYLALSKERRCSAHTVLEMIPDYEIQKKVDL